MFCFVIGAQNQGAGSKPAQQNNTGKPSPGSSKVDKKEGKTSGKDNQHQTNNVNAESAMTAQVTIPDDVSAGNPGSQSQTDKPDLKLKKTKPTEVTGTKKQVPGAIRQEQKHQKGENVNG